ncbi:hypothetical protein [Halorubrum sp. F4]|uniref:hypothetical protein n=1 Tax=Halorubrum sp. F4 TaxID=2989715 RepID=UPI00247FEBD3|nr:hypothetical protein [Halorubrum sp. F4]
MTGVELTDRGLVVDREPNRLDELAIGFSEVLRRLDIDHVFVAGYVSILAGRSRSTEDIDVFIERCPADRLDQLVAELEREGYWGPAMPLSEMYGNLSNDTKVWVAPDGEMTPHLEVKFPGDEFDEASLRNAIDAHVGDHTIPIGPLELQIAYKLSLGGRTDLEDTAHLYAVFGETLSPTRLEAWVERLDVEDRYERLTNV